MYPSYLYSWLVSTYIILEFVESADLLIEFLRVDSGNVKAEMQKCRDMHVQVNSLREIYSYTCCYYMNMLTRVLCNRSCSGYKQGRP